MADEKTEQDGSSGEGSLAELEARDRAENFPLPLRAPTRSRRSCPPCSSPRPLLLCSSKSPTSASNSPLFKPPFSSLLVPLAPQFLMVLKKKPPKKVQNLFSFRLPYLMTLQQAAKDWVTAPTNTTPRPHCSTSHCWRRDGRTCRLTMA